MAVGGKRRITVAPNLVCYGGAFGESVSKGDDSDASCSLIISKAAVRKEALIVEATLKASCIPGFSTGPILKRQVRCRDSDIPRREPTDPIWHIYEAPPSSP
jgi:hypothetical protein